jgi:hypothetical protein
MRPEGFDLDRLRKLDEEYIRGGPHTPWNGCAECIGMAPQNIIDCVYKALREIPTDALMRELARRFL